MSCIHYNVQPHLKEEGQGEEEEEGEGEGEG